jgi:hypothetical protein
MEPMPKHPADSVQLALAMTLLAACSVNLLLACAWL